MQTTSVRAPALHFAFLLLCIALPLVYRVWGLRAYYLHPALRAKTQVTLEFVAKEQGWILSDLSLRDVDPFSLSFVEQEHRRGGAPAHCYVVALGTSHLYPCAK